MASETFEIKLPLFEGPFDLLLFFIERNELDIYDIPISKITNEFLQYIRHLEKMNMEVASEFILVASTLMSIKAKMLLPRPELDEEGNEIDPREELVKHLLEYKRYKSVLNEIREMEERRQSMTARGNASEEVASYADLTNTEAELQHVDLYKLLKTYAKMMERFEARQNQPVHTVTKYPYTISEQKSFIMKRLEYKEDFSFNDLITYYHDKVAVIFSFLAILELLQQQILKITIGHGYNNFWIRRNPDVEYEDD